jgi:hypothetical protein
MMEEVQKPSNSECYTPSSVPFRIYWQDFCLLLAGFLLLLDLEDGESTFLQNVGGLHQTARHHISTHPSSKQLCEQYAGTC